MNNQYFIYGLQIPYTKYLELKDGGKCDVSEINDDIQGIFTGRDNNFMIIGKILKNINTENNRPLIVPILEDIDKYVIEKSIQASFELEGDYHYFFINNSECE